ncbi:MAG: argininosuccinate lyase [bacterium]|nr:argininosuccinate lyase [bacterium]
MALTPRKSAKWSGRFKEGLDPQALRFTASIDFDRQLYFFDILGSIAQARALGRAKVLKPVEVKKIEKGLHSILNEIEAGRFSFRLDLEDIHRNIEEALIRKIGPLGGKLHTGRSRNDQVALDLRLYCRERLQELFDALTRLQRSAVKKAREYKDAILPGYTHLQRAQPILFAHWLLAYVEMWDRDRGRIFDCLKRMNSLPLGAGALAGSAFPINRGQIAKELGFSDVCHNSLDAVSDRDFVIETASAGSLLMMHFSRLCEELVLWSSSEFKFIHLPESFCTGSSMMPQKVNPDVPELIRGKTGRVYGTLVSLLTLMKSLPLAYNKDLQEDKEPLFDLFETTLQSTSILAAMIAKMRLNQESVREALQDDSLLATDLADYLVKKGLPFRQAHEVVGKLVLYGADHDKPLHGMTLKELKQFSEKFSDDIHSVLSVEGAVAARQVVGGTAPKRVREEIEKWEQRLK